MNRRKGTTWVRMLSSMSLSTWLLLLVITQHIYASPVLIAHSEEGYDGDAARALIRNMSEDSTASCDVFIESGTFLNGDSEDMVCWHDDGVSPTKRLVEIEGTPNWLYNRLNNGDVLSGRDTLVAEGAYYSYSTSGRKKFVIPSGSNSSLHRSDPSVTSVDIRKTLVIRVATPLSSLTRSASQLSEDVFGGGTDIVNLKSQYLDCSNGQIRFEPVDDVSGLISNGVMDITIDIASNDAKDSLDAAIDEMEKLPTFGTLDDHHYDHFMFCIPPGITYKGRDDWVAFAVIDNKYTAYNDEWCSYVSSQMHEIGHNLNLAHSAEGGVEYGDLSGYMGSSYMEDDFPSMCFNGPKTWQLGWYSDHHLNLNPSDASSPGSELWSGQLYGFVDHDVAPGDSTMIIRLDYTSARDIYISFNRKKGFNSQTQEGEDKVMVHSKKNDEDEHGMSYLLAKLGSGDEFSMSSLPSHNSDLIIRVLNVTSTEPMSALIQIVKPCEDGPNLFTSSVTVVPSTNDVIPITKTCSWLQIQSEAIQKTICGRDLESYIETYNLPPPPYDECCETCMEALSEDDDPSGSYDDIVCIETGTEIFFEKMTSTGPRLRSCNWLAKKPPNRIDSFCKSGDYYEEHKSAWDACVVTCERCIPEILPPSDKPSDVPTHLPSDVPSSTPSSSPKPTSSCFDENFDFFVKTKTLSNGTIKVTTKSCSWLRSKSENKIKKQCRKNKTYDDDESGNVLIPAAKDVCLKTCDKC